VFGFITKVIEEKTPYYAYEDIHLYMEGFPQFNFKESKKNRLAFKIVNYFNPKKILELGAGDGTNTLYITAPSSHIRCFSVETSSRNLLQAQNLYRNWRRDIVLSREVFPDMEGKMDAIFLNLRLYKADPERLTGYLLSLVKEDSFIFIDGIRTNRAQQALWKNLIKREEAGVSLDLFHVGILFFNKKYFKRNYKLSF
jgi:hypothetical protein